MRVRTQGKYSLTKRYQFIKYIERHLVTRLSSAPPWNLLVHFGPNKRPINQIHSYNIFINKFINK